MDNVRTWQPFDLGLTSREDAERARRWFGFDRPGAGPWMDVYESDENIVVEVSLPGVSAEDFTVTVTGQTLTIQGEMKPEPQDDKRQYLHRERVYGRFYRSVELPGDVKGADAEARFERGVLTLTMPKAEETRPRQIQVKAG